MGKTTFTKKHTISEYYTYIPGKSGSDNTLLPLWVHLEDTAGIIKWLCSKRISLSVIKACELDCVEFEKICRFLALVHDIGKCTPLFVSRITQILLETKKFLQEKGLDVPKLNQYNYPDKSPHPLAGEIILRREGCPEGICAIVGAHHGKPSHNNVTVNYQITQLDVCSQNYYGRQKEIWQEMQRMILADALRESGYASVNDLPQLSNCAQMLLSGLLIEADWMSSNTWYYPTVPINEAISIDCNKRTEDAIKRLSMPEKWNIYYDWNGAEKLFTERFRFKPNPMQRITAEIAHEMPASGLMIIEAQMGLGKTEAALAAAEILSEKGGCGGLYFGLPTQATSNGIFPRLAEWAEAASTHTHSIRLAHGMAELNENYTSYHNSRGKMDEDGDSELIVHSWFSGRKQALLADFVVGTVDTALMTALKQKHVMLRHIGLCGKTVIIDECHAYDAYMSKYLQRMLRWLGAYHVPVILLSATLPRDRKAELITSYLTNHKKGRLISLPEQDGYPLITWTQDMEVRARAVTEGNVPKSVKIHCISNDSLPEHLHDKMKDGGCVGIIVNTVRRAQEIGEKLKIALPGKTVFIHHAQFVAEDRAEREKELIHRIGKESKLEDRHNFIVVGTQVLEQSLDIDFDYLITDLCPMDLLLQRIGRLHRHTRMRPSTLQQPECSVLYADGELENGAKRIYTEWLLNRTKMFLPESITIPSDIPNLVNRVYAEPTEEEQNEEWKTYKNMIEIEEGKAGVWLLGNPKQSRREQGNSLVGMLDDDVGSEHHAEAAVRDTQPSIDVLVIVKKEDEHIGFLPWISEDRIRTDTVPSDEECRKIALQRLRLPLPFCVGEKIDYTVSLLEQEDRTLLSQWNLSPWLNGELILLLDENLEKDFGEYHLKYEKDIGLTYNIIKKEGVS